VVELGLTLRVELWEGMHWTLSEFGGWRYVKSIAGGLGLISSKAVSFK
jgi:hypothetical protein